VTYSLAHRWPDALHQDYHREIYLIGRLPKIAAVRSSWVEIEKEGQDQVLNAQGSRRNSAGEVCGCNLACSFNNLWEVDNDFDADCLEALADTEIKVVKSSRGDRRLLC
jgi:hypothetical protein